MPLRTRHAPLLRRASRRRLTLLASAIACGALGAPLASATPLPPSADPLPGSLFQGGDGNQDDALPRTDWQALRAANRVNHNPDPNGADTAFAGGSKEDEPGSWDLTTEADGVNPSKDDVLDAWSSYDPHGAQAFLNLAFTRQGAAGTTFVTFELNHDVRLWNNGQARIPCRRSGDLLVSYEAQGNDVSVVIQRWVTTVTDTASGCAEKGVLDEYTQFAPNIDAQGGINPGAIANYLPGFFDSTIPLHLFGEASLNLESLMGAGFNDPCFSFGSFWMHSRSSLARLSSQMQDYIAPRPVAVRTCAASGTKFHDLNANGRRDPGEPGLPRYVIWADYDDDGVRDDIEPFAVTDSEGQYVINDIRPPDGTYMLRETLLTARARRRAHAGNVTCSYPNDNTTGGTGSATGGLFPCGWGPIETATTTYARGRDFGNYVAGPPPPPPPPPPPSPIIPPGPKPPDAGDAGHAGILLRQAARACIGPRVPRVDFHGSRIARIQLFVNGRLRRRLTLGALQRRVTPRVRLAPGRYRLRVRVTFQRGSGSPPVNLTRVVRICRVKASRPPFTG